MARILVLGVGPIPARHAAPAPAAGARAWQFARALAEAGHEVELALAGGEAPRTRIVVTAGKARFRVSGLDSDQIDSPAALRSRLDAGEYRALVGASTYASFLLARSGHPAPLWIDLQGDPMSEAQALAQADACDGAIDRFTWMLEWCLRRGDRFSAVSGPQRHAVLGQLGAAGRLNRATAGADLVHTVPDACEVPDPVPRPVRGAAFEILFAGSFNTWIDGDSFVAAIAIALAEEPTVSFRICGGEVPGFVERPWRRFADRVGALEPSHRARVELSSWVPGEDLERMEAAAGCGVVPELRLVERELGSQNRSLRWMARARPVVTTAQSELGQAVAERGLGLTYPPGDWRALADCMLRLARDPERAAELGSRARAWVLAARTIEVTTRPLVEWASDALPAADRNEGSLEPIIRRRNQLMRDQLHLDERWSSRRVG
jgi:glycosyltransferase involved in cell wall biosynthesis